VPSYFARGKKVRCVKIQMGVEIYVILPAIDVVPANQHDTKADLDYPLVEAGRPLDITVEATARGRDGRFVPAGICWLVERSFAWLSRYNRLNNVFEHSRDHVIAFVAIAFISSLSQRPNHVVVPEFRARPLRPNTWVTPEQVQAWVRTESLRRPPRC
jgi:hypothetical protein